MKLNFLGNGSAFSNDHTSAFFVTDEIDFVLIDCPTNAYQRLKNEFDLSIYRNIFVYITHTHGDHVGGLSMLIQYAHYALNKHIIVVAPSQLVAKDLKSLLKIQGVADVLYTLTTTYDFISTLMTENHPIIPTKAYGFSVNTRHVKPLKEKCFGYVFEIDGTRVIYTGDTATLSPFLPFFTKDAEFYIDTSVEFKTEVHLFLEDILPTLKQIVESGGKVYLMHLDDVAKANEMVSEISGIEVVHSV